MKNAGEVQERSDYPGVDRADRHVLDIVPENADPRRATSPANSRAIYIHNTTPDCAVRTMHNN
jgi:hypothetical protein